MYSPVYDFVQSFYQQSTTSDDLDFDCVWRIAEMTKQSVSAQKLIQHVGSTIVGLIEKPF